MTVLKRKEKRMAFTPVRDLYCDSVSIKPIDYDWSQLGSTWESYEAVRCEECKEIVFSNGEEHHDRLDTVTVGEDNEPCNGYLPVCEGPMMSYYYPIPSSYNERIDPKAFARKLVDLPLCVVRFEANDKLGIALTGGGMDFSWEICEAFMLLGFLPPLHFAELPQMAGRGVSEHDRWIIAGCERSAIVASQWARSKLKGIRALRRALCCRRLTDEQVLAEKLAKEGAK